MGCCASKELRVREYEKGVVDSGSRMEHRSGSASKLSRHTNSSRSSRNATSHLSLSKGGGGGGKERPSVSSQYHRDSHDSPLSRKRPSRSRSYDERERDHDGDDELDHNANATVRRRRTRRRSRKGGKEEVEVSYTPSRSQSDSRDTRHSYSYSDSSNARRHRNQNNKSEGNVDFDAPPTQPSDVDESTYFHSQTTLTRKSTLQGREVPVTSPLTKRQSFSASVSRGFSHRGSFSRRRALTASSESHFRASKHNLQIRIGDDSTLFTQGSGTGTILGSKSESMSNALTPPEVMDTDDSEAESSEASVPDLGMAPYTGSYHTRAQTYGGFFPPDHDTSTMRRISPYPHQFQLQGEGDGEGHTDPSYLYSPEENNASASLITHPFSHDSSHTNPLSSETLTNSGQYLAPMNRANSNASLLSHTHGRHHTFSELSFKSIPSACNTELPAFGDHQQGPSSFSREQYTHVSLPQGVLDPVLPYASAPIPSRNHTSENGQSVASSQDFLPQTSHKHIVRHATGTSITSATSTSSSYRSQSFPTPAGGVTRTRSLSNNVTSPLNPHHSSIYTHKPRSMSRSKSKSRSSRRRKAATAAAAVSANPASSSPPSTASAGPPKSLSRSTQYLQRTSSARSLSSAQHHSGERGEEFSRSHLSLASSDARAGFTSNCAQEISSSIHQSPPDNVSESPELASTSSTSATSKLATSHSMPAREHTHASSVANSSVANVALPAHRRATSHPPFQMSLPEEAPAATVPLPHTGSPPRPPEDDALSVASEGGNSLFSVSAPSISHIAVAGSPCPRESRDSTMHMLADLSEGDELLEGGDSGGGGGTDSHETSPLVSAVSATTTSRDAVRGSMASLPSQGDDTSLNKADDCDTRGHMSDVHLRAATPSTSVSRRSSFEERKDDGSLSPVRKDQRSKFSVGESSLYEEDLPAETTSS